MFRPDMRRAIGPLVKTLLFTVLVPGTVAVAVPRYLIRGFPMPTLGVLPALGATAIILGASIYFRCAWEFAVRGLGTPAPIAPTKFLVVSGLHRYVRNPMYLGVALVILGEAALFRAPHLAVYAALMLLVANMFVVFYEEPTLRRQFGESYEQYRRTVPRWIPRFTK
jgi:protein-S-isoprenylcysteine O-methyltransferase Ste14